MPKKIIVRIQGGKWKRSCIQSLAFVGVRPTLGRMRQTLSDWVRTRQPLRVLDVFAGTGALGFELASQGAHTVTMIENNRQLVKMLEATKNNLTGANTVVTIYCNDAYVWLAQNKQSYDILLLDPPFDCNFENLITTVCTSYAVGVHTYIYCEHPKKLAIQFPKGWHAVKKTSMGDVAAELWKFL